MKISLFYSLVNLVIYVPVVYFSYRIIQNIEGNEDASSAMFFLRDSSRQTFRYGALMVASVLIGEILVFARFFYSDLMLALGYTLLTVASLGVLYFVRGVFLVTFTPTEAEEREM